MQRYPSDSIVGALSVSLDTTYNAIQAFYLAYEREKGGGRIGGGEEVREETIYCCCVSVWPYRAGLD